MDLPVSSTQSVPAASARGVAR